MNVQHRQLLMSVNEEKIRRIMVGLHAKLPEYQRLSGSDKGLFKQLHSDRCQAIPQVRNVYERTRVKSTRNNYRSLSNSILTLKKIVTEHSTMNSPANKAKRLQMCSKETEKRNWTKFCPEFRSKERD
ncbi:hypothetical protein PTSG_08769 [Salpingoeca rosetta]|uniref:Uncharacterized protein n=1 Tax=Salpingoeca rosetta (strain ATCC 50818 / BSB-021) TaxID=946362 RepID=F2UKM8_SALR5|nr:uncharacterized protein PTSG_08769 [Salpingoeca rosetta]EGD77677.1 hypothetical protein PTSG_08769 [Salpingoeca rosetta]|eukprot:XP_004990153.1 hypothetical protein PTSG_08769 [Salpingoeca rosetta]